MALPATIHRRLQDDPFVEVQREFDTMLNRLFGGTPTSPQRTDGRRSAPYAVDVHEDANHLYFEVELPGFKKDEVDVTLDRNVLTVTAERQTAAPSKGDNGETPRRDVLLNERRYTYFSRSFTLPPTVGGDDPVAKLEDGVLHLTLNKREETKPRKISVN